MRCRLILFASERLKDIMTNLRDGKSMSWEVGVDTRDLYLKHQLQGEEGNDGTQNQTGGFPLRCRYWLTMCFTWNRRPVGFANQCHAYSRLISGNEKRPISRDLGRLCACVRFGLVVHNLP